MQRAAEAANVQIVTGDTKVVDKGKGDGIFINTAGVGVIEHQSDYRPIQRSSRRCHPAEWRHRAAWHGDHGGT